MAEILFTETRDILVDKQQVPVPRSSLEGKVLAIMTGPNWLPKPLEHALSVIAEPSKQLLQDKDKPIAFVYVASERDPHLIATIKKYGQADQLDERPDEECFQNVLSKLPEGWFAVPLAESEARSKIIEAYKTDVFSLAFVGADGTLHQDQGLQVLERWGSEAYPFDQKRIQELELQRKEKLQNQNVKELLANEDRDFLVKSEGDDTVKVADLEGKTVGLYFSAHWCPPCQRFTPMLASIYTELKKRNENFEIVFLSSDEDQTSFNNYFKEMPWLAVPYSDMKTKKLLNNWFEVEGIPTLVLLDKHGKTITTDGTELIHKYGIDAYPFNEERLEQLKQEEEAKRLNQTLESLLVTQERNFVVSKFNQQVKVASLVGKTVGLYFSGHWCPPCRNFTPKLVAAYDELKNLGEEFEIIFVSSDRDEDSFNGYYESMPWLALPFSDKVTKQSLSRYFEVQGIPKLIIIGPDEKTVTTDGRGLVNTYGADGFPFTEDRIAELKRKIDEKYKNLPKEVTTDKHEHPLTLTECDYNGQVYVCDDCDEPGSGWAYHCDECGYDLHVECVGEKGKAQAGNGDSAPSSDGCKPGYVCEGGVCQKVDGESAAAPPPSEGCKPGYVCIGGVCQKVDSDSAPPPSDGCKPGYVCEGGVCQKVDGESAAPPSDGCQPGYVCEGGVCQKVDGESAPLPSDESKPGYVCEGDVCRKI